MALLGVALLVAGLLVTGVQTGGFDQVDADRGVSVEVAPQSTSYLAIQDSYSGDPVRDCVFFCIIPVDIPREVLTLENRYVEDYTEVTAEIDSVEGASAGTFQITDQPSQQTITNQPSQIPEGQNSAVFIDCATDSDGTGTATITFEMSATSQNASIAGATTTVDAIQYDCRG